MEPEAARVFEPLAAQAEGADAFAPPPERAAPPRARTIAEPPLEEALTETMPASAEAPAGGPAAAPRPRKRAAPRPRGVATPGASVADVRAAPPLPKTPREALRGAAKLALLALGRAAVLAYRARAARQGISVAILAGLVVYGSVRVRASVRSEIAYRVSKGSLAATVPPKGLARDAIDDLAGIPLPGRSFSVYDPAAVPAIAATYRALPWVREVRAVQVFFPAVVRFDVVVRRPVCGLAHGGKSFLIDDEGVVLPRRCYEPGDADALRLPTIVNAPFGRRALREGQRLDDVPVKHGIAVALALQAEAFDQLRLAAPISIDVSNVDGRVDPRQSEIVVTAGRTVIEWGRSSATSKLDIPVEEKIAKLRTLLDRDPALASLALVRLQFDDLEFKARAPAQPN
jgi:hypothetical protein